MSIQFGDMCSLLLREHFGKTAEAIHKELRWGPKTFKLIVSGCKLPPSLVKRALSVLIQYNFVRFEPGRIPTVAEYILLPENIVLLLRFPRYLTIINEKYGAPSKLIVETILKNGNSTASKTIVSVWKQLQTGILENYKDGVTGVRDAFRVLVNKQYLSALKIPAQDEKNERVPQISQDESEIARMPEIDASILNKMEAGEPVAAPDADIYWKCNVDRFHQDMRDSIMVEAIRSRIDGHAAFFMEVLLKKMYLRTEGWATQSNPVPILEIKEETEHRNPHLTQYLDQYIKIMDEDSCNFIRRSGEGTSGSVFINFDKAFQSLASATIESIVEHRFGPKAARIFRLVRFKKYIDQDQLQKLAMIPDKEAKQLTYKLIQGSFLHMHELKKSSTAGPSKNFYLLHVDFNQVVHVVLDMCYKAIYNTLSRTEHETMENMRLIEKFDKLNTIASNMKAQGEDPEYIAQLLEEWITPPERTLLSTVEVMIEKLRLAELYMEETILVLNLYSFYASASMKEKLKKREK
ncbi:Hypothetical protein polymerase III [Nesidiocoris tenuis]|uniref:DNA-directed RNA polymerase III subunit RPC3 n=1 Tax=Nesidiocoris tenuis TaxID=355587 RepID=A0ABN7ACS1_9HEMI|nr:Hypothetical protein polymerase III [Nesidiocoris tenuis]